MVGITGFKPGMELIEVPGFDAGHGNDDLGQHIQRAENGMHRFDVLAVDSPSQYSRVQNVPRIDREEGPSADFPYPVPCPADPLNCRRTDGGA